MKQAVKWGMLVQNPVALIEPPRLQRKEMQALSPAEAKLFLSAASEDKYGIVFAFALATGMRPEEYLGLQWKDVDLTKGIATVQRTLVELRGGGWQFGEPKTSRSRRTVPVPGSVVRSLVEHKRKQAEVRFKAGPAYQPHDLVFAMPDGGPMKLRNLLRRHFKPILKMAGLPDSIRLYDVRHSCATLLLAGGENPKIVSERLGHASIVLTPGMAQFRFKSAVQLTTRLMVGVVASPAVTMRKRLPSGVTSYIGPYPNN
jgi:integrase